MTNGAVVGAKASTTIADSPTASGPWGYSSCPGETLDANRNQNLNQDQSGVVSELRKKSNAVTVTIKNNNRSDGIVRRINQIMRDGGASINEAMVIGACLGVAKKIIEEEMKQPMPGIAMEVYDNLLDTLKDLYYEDDDLNEPSVVPEPGSPLYWPEYDRKFT